MSRFVLKRDVELTLWGRTITVPKGASLRFIKHADGATGDLYAVADTSLLIRLTGDSRNARNHYALVPPDAVLEVPFVPIKRTPARRYRI